MAHLFLHAQGLVEEPTVASMDSMPAADDLLPANLARAKAEQDVRNMWNAEWLILRQQPKEPETRRAFLKAYVTSAPYFIMLRDHCLENIDRFDELVRIEQELMEDCLRG